MLSLKESETVICSHTQTIKSAVEHRPEASHFVTNGDQWINTPALSDSFAGITEMCDPFLIKFKLLTVISCS